MSMPTKIAPPVSAVIGATISDFISYTPELVKEISYIVLLFLVADQITGMVRAAYSRGLSSKEARTRILPKMAQYFGLICLASGAAIATHSWAWVVAGLFGVCAMEAVSITENLVALEKQGAKLGPVAILLRRISHVFGDPNKDKEKTDETEIKG